MGSPPGRPAPLIRITESLIVHPDGIMNAKRNGHHTDVLLRDSPYFVSVEDPEWELWNTVLKACQNWKPKWMKRR